ncbi:MAG: hypothetical protein M1821_009732 [Bathelium mastoideum]|nr:MAG: hypothetical protein M1821_009732 [Bathelium mastoideum]
MIHGIVIQERSSLKKEAILVIWGSRRLRLACVSFAYEKPKVKLGPEVSASDWILDASFAPTGDSWPELENEEVADGRARVALATAHCALLQLSWEVPANDELSSIYAGDPPSLTKLTAASRCILYSANVIWLSKTRILVAAGTVFGEILVWSCNTNLSIGGNVGTLTHNIFTGHEGSVFGVRISPPLVLFPGKAPQRLLASCSDDRTIRIWEITSDEKFEGPSNLREIKSVSKHGNTGFGGSEVDEPAGNLAQDDQIAWAWGHASRIWNVYFLPRTSFREPMELVSRLVSVGEDATCQFWDLSRKETGQLMLRHLQSSEHHSGKNIWSSTVLHKDQCATRIITGGADGSVVSHFCPHTVGSENYSNNHEEWTIDRVSEMMAKHPFLVKEIHHHSREFDDNHTKISVDRAISAMPHSTTGDLDLQLEPNDMFREYAFIGSNVFLTMTKAGTLLMASTEAQNPRSGFVKTDGKTSTEWLRLMDFRDLRNDSILSRCCTPRPLPCAFIGGRGGTIYRYDHESGLISEFAKIDGKVSGLFLDCIDLTSTNSKTAPKLLSLTVAIGGEKYVDNFLYKCHGLRLSHAELRRSRLYLPDDFIIISVKHICVNMQLECLFFGSRNGSVAIYTIKRVYESFDSDVPLSTTLESHNQQPTLLLKTIHGKEAVTSILWLPGSQIGARSGRADDSGYLFSTGRDGTCSIHYLVIESDSVSSNLIHKVSLPFGPFVEGVHIDAETNDLYTWGFRNKRFVLWNETTADEMMSVECGGAHRNWAFCPSQRDQGGIFVWTKAKVCNVYRQRYPLHRLVRRGGHGREIKSIAAAPVPFCVDGKVTHLVATGAEDTDIRIFEYGHTISTELADEGSFCCRRVLRKHNTGIQHLQWSEDGQYLFSSGGFEEFFVWRIQSALIVRIASFCESILPFKSENPDLRITNFDVRQQAQGDQHNGQWGTVFDIACGYSDSTVRIYKYRSIDNEGTWQHLYTGAYGPNHACLTQCIFLPSNTTLLTAGGDGHVAVWDISSASSAEGVIQQTNMTDAETIPQTCELRFMIHQSSVKTLAHYQLDNDTALLVTGGDDNALGVSLVSVKRTESERTLEHSNAAASVPYSKVGQMTLSTLLIPRAHAAAITAVAIVTIDPTSTRSSGSNPRIFRVITSSNDQRLKLWGLSIDMGLPGVQGVQVQRLANESCGVADLADMAVLPSFNGEDLQIGRDGSREQDKTDEVGLASVVVCGVGMEVWKFALGE